MVSGVVREKTGGRQIGSTNKRTRELEIAAGRARGFAERALGRDAFTGDAHALLCMVYKDVDMPIEMRVDAAKAAIPYEKPRLAAIAARIENEVTYASLIMKAVESVAKKEIMIEVDDE